MGGQLAQPFIVRESKILDCNSVDSCDRTQHEIDDHRSDSFSSGRCVPVGLGSECDMPGDQQLFKWCLINARSIKNKIADFSQFLYSSAFDFVCITETWLDNSCPDKVFFPDGYNVFRQDRALTCGGGVAIVVKAGLNVSRVVVSENFDSLELVCVDLSLHEIDYRLICFYRPPGSKEIDVSYINDAVQCFRKLCSTYKTIFILGDFNLPAIDWDHYGSPDSNIYSIFLNFVNDFGLHQFVHSPTRGEHILDLVFCSSEQAILDLSVESPFSNSDHCSIILSTKSEIPYEKLDEASPVYFNYNKANFQGFQMYLETINMDHIFSIFSVNDFWNSFVNLLYNAIELDVHSVVIN